MPITRQEISFKLADGHEHRVLYPVLSWEELKSHLTVAELETILNNRIRHFAQLEGRQNLKTEISVDESIGYLREVGKGRLI